MKRLHAAAIATLAFGTSTAYAQVTTSSVSLFGRLDEGIVYQTGKTGGSSVSMAANMWLPSLWGLRGQEDLGGGLSAVFNLASTIIVNTGSSASSQKLFDRNAYVGLSSNDWGTLTFGRQVNTLAELFYVTDPLYANSSATNMNVRLGYLGGPGTTIQNNFGPNPGVSGASLDRVDNAVKYQVKKYGFTGMAMYGFGGAAGQFSNNSSAGAMVGYDGGVATLRASYMQYKDNIGTLFFAYAGGASYKLGPVTLRATFTQNRIDSGLNTTARPYRNMQTQVISGGGDWLMSPSFDLYIAYYRGKRSQDGLPDQVANKFYIVPSYFLSKRTTLQIVSVYERFNATGAALDTGTPLATNVHSSVYVGLGMTHNF
ncbi:porin [Paraburkholderia sp. C35]|uniref:porin n=1 Tax=Paraburkholderia sp. C35 TaxID=2126993 RepID=UPI000D69152F|nr:porin [Paraburkholderia sp. C35]